MATRQVTDKDLIFTAGPFKMEVVPLEAVVDNDTFVSKLANPSFALAINNGDAELAGCSISASVSGKTVTVHDPDISTVLVLVFGDALI